MSSKLIKNGTGKLVVPGDEVVVGQVNILQSGNINVNAPNIHPLFLAKIFSSLSSSIIEEFLKEMQNQQNQEEKSPLVGNG